MFTILFFIGGEKRGLNCVKAVLGTDGTEIDEDYMECLENNTVLLLLQEHEKGTCIKFVKLCANRAHVGLHYPLIGFYHQAYLY